MAWWMTVYCREPLATLDAAQVDAGLRGDDPSAPAGIDYPSLAEDHELDEDQAALALAHLRVTHAGAHALDLEIRYRPEPDARPIVVHPWTEPARVVEELDEAREGRDPPPEALARLADVRAVIGIELGFAQLRDMGLVIACELARYLAQKGDGVIVDDEGEWFAVVDGEFVDP